MGHNDALSKGLAIVGTLLVWPAIVAPVFFSAIGLIQSGRFRFDWLMPAELFPTVVLGGALLLWAALRARARRKIVAWGLGGAVGLLVAVSIFAQASGLASGETEPTGWMVGLGAALFAMYALAVVDLAIAGVLLIRDVFRRSPDSGSPVVSAG